jgi:glycosyltransferase involved in cell wall biosynthesis
MKLVIFTPAIQASAIGRMARLVTRALHAAGHRVTVVRAEDADLLDRPAHDFGVPLVTWTDTARVEALLAEADGIVYQMGDNYVYHRGCMEWLPRAPGVVCLHDFFLGHLFTGWAGSRRPEATRTLQAWYGEAATRGFFAHASSAEFIEGTHQSAPMTEWLCAFATGVISHSNWGIDRVLASCPGPVRVVPLPYSAPAGTSPSGGHRELDSDFELLTVGHVNPNKRAEIVIQAVANSELLKSRVTYRLLGAITPDASARLTALAAGLGVKLDIHGEASEAELGAALDAADAVCCLRWPTLEAASASTIEAMLCGKPVIVELAGFYAELPEDCVSKVRPSHELADLQRALETLYQDPQGRRQMGQRAAEWARNTFTAENYASQLVDVAEASAAAAAVADALADSVSTLRRWGGMDHLFELPQTLEPLSVFSPSHAGEAQQPRSTS